MTRIGSAATAIAGALVLIAAGLIATFPASAQTQVCEHTISLPGVRAMTYTITTAGVYCLGTDVTMAASFTSGPAIEIVADDVVLDLNGHSVSGGAAGSGTQAIGIHASQRRTLTIKNGRVSGFNTGISLEDLSPYTISFGHRVVDIRADENTVVGIQVMGVGNLVSGNRVMATGGAGFYSFASGIKSFGTGARILDNDVVEMKKADGTVAVEGIALVSATEAVVEGNRVGNGTRRDGTGIAADGGSRNLVIGNRVIGYNLGVFTSNTGNTAKCRDNLFANVGTQVFGCLDVANNN